MLYVMGLLCGGASNSAHVGCGTVYITQIGNLLGSETGIGILGDDAVEPCSVSGSSTPSPRTTSTSA